MKEFTLSLKEDVNLKKVIRQSPNKGENEMRNEVWENIKILTVSG